jgi:hypothetical protein
MRNPEKPESKAPVKLRMTVKKRVDMPTIKVSVPAIERRSFQILILL